MGVLEFVYGHDSPTCAMSDAIQFHSRVGDDGILDVQVDLGRTEAKKEVVVTIESLRASDEARQAADMPWSDFVEQTYGSCDRFGTGAG